MNILPVIKINNKLYFEDTRLKQYRSVVPYREVIEFIDFGEEPWKEDDIELICYHNDFSSDMGCPDCRFTDVFAAENQ